MEPNRSAAEQEISNRLIEDPHHQPLSRRERGAIGSSFDTLRFLVLRLSGFLVFILLQLAGPGEVWAHEGPPFPILVDKPAAGQLVSVWADPDIGEATFFIIIETPDGRPPRQIPGVSMWTEPTSGRLERVRYEAMRQKLRNQVQFKAEPQFDQRDMWTVGFTIVTPDGESAELTTEVESTPPGYGVWDLAIYLFPFLLLGGLWVLAMIRRRRMIRAERLDTRPAADQARRDQDLAEK